ncbi:MAG: hypothetical protein QOH05_1138, partial [Acetobacteraceae bacterium]|nr:hypothetical protein [Acetobacteraceae bacterium]
MRKSERSGPALISAVMLLLLTTLGASSQEIGLVTLDTKEVAKG